MQKTEAFKAEMMPTNLAHQPLYPKLARRLGNSGLGRSAYVMLIYYVVCLKRIKLGPG